RTRKLVRHITELAHRRLDLGAGLWRDHLRQPHHPAHGDCGYAGPFRDGGQGRGGLRLELGHRQSWTGHGWTVEIPVLDTPTRLRTHDDSAIITNDSAII